MAVLPPRVLADAAAQFVLALSLRNACATFFDDRVSMHRVQLVLPERGGDEQVLHGFNERSLTYLRLATVRDAAEHERRTIARCERRPLGIGLTVSHMNSVYHQMFHAPPGWETAHAWTDGGGPVTFVPLVFASAAIGRGKPAQPWRWHGWEFTLRALTDRPWAELARATSRLLLAPCTCFDRFEAHPAPFNPGARGNAARLRAFRDAALQRARRVHALAVAPRVEAYPEGAVAAQDVLYVSRAEGRRAVSNELVLLAALSAQHRLKRVVLEGLSLSEQMLLVAASTTIVAVHGQALAWVPFLPYERRRTAVVELVLNNQKKRFNDCYSVWCKALGVRYFRVAAQLTGGCTGGATNRDNEAVRQNKLLSCNVTVDIGQTVAATRVAAQMTEVKS
ncbi:hypothetical protein AB1Y20_006226 [Prymnesium parvum]|uniref:Glycosyltransferase 61 catalytic domain-containing protein n=1 Tax=Prymnesium parvum TaxID=97485 RepID=A0AB34J263_PRYPA